MTLRDAWEGNAADWIRWARTPDHDHFYWRFNRPNFLALLPAPGRLTVDVACGEGRLARELRELGHRIVAIDGSPTLVAAARASDADLDVRLADAAACLCPTGWRTSWSATWGPGRRRHAGSGVRGRPCTRAGRPRLPARARREALIAPLGARAGLGYRPRHR